MDFYGWKKYVKEYSADHVPGMTYHQIINDWERERTSLLEKNKIMDEVITEEAHKDHDAFYKMRAEGIKFLRDNLVKKFEDKELLCGIIILEAARALLGSGDSTEPGLGGE